MGLLHPHPEIMCATTLPFCLCPSFFLFLFVVFIVIPKNVTVYENMFLAEPYLYLNQWNIINETRLSLRAIFWVLAVLVVAVLGAEFSFWAFPCNFKARSDFLFLVTSDTMKQKKYVKFEATLITLCDEHFNSNCISTNCPTLTNRIWMVDVQAFSP